MKVFLGGTCNNSRWRNRLIPQLTVESFNPVVPEWNEEAYQRELKEREECDKCLYVLTPASDSPYSIAEVVDDSNKRPGKTVFAFTRSDEDGVLTDHQMKAYNKVGLMVEANGGTYVRDYDTLADILNGR